MDRKYKKLHERFLHACHELDVITFRGMIENMHIDPAYKNDQHGNAITALGRLNMQNKDDFYFILTHLLNMGCDVNYQHREDTILIRYSGKWQFAEDSSNFQTHAAFLKERCHLICLLLKHGANVDINPGGCGTALLASCHSPSQVFLPICRLLIEASADVNATGHGEFGEVGVTPLMEAARHNNVSFFNLLISLGANPFLAQSNGLNVFNDHMVQSEEIKIKLIDLCEVAGRWPIIWSLSPYAPKCFVDLVYHDAIEYDSWRVIERLRALYLDRLSSSSDLPLPWTLVKMCVDYLFCKIDIL
jgi:ankyrin repeat protein